MNLNNLVFTKVDLSNGYWHVQLDEESSKPTTFQACYGRCRWLRLPFGTSILSEIFQRKLLEALQGPPDMVCIVDDAIIHRKTVEEHDSNLDMFVERCKEKCIKLNKDKMQVNMEEVPFMGHHRTKDGLQPDPKKISAVTKMAPPLQNYSSTWDRSTIMLNISHTCLTYSNLFRT